MQKNRSRTRIATSSSSRYDSAHGPPSVPDASASHRSLFFSGSTKISETPSQDKGLPTQMEGKKLKKWDTVEPEYNDKTPISPSTEIGPMEAEVVDGKRSMVQYSTYAAKKTVAQGMMDIALITANANQLRYLIEFQRNAATFYLTLTLIIISIALQILVGILLVFKGRVEKGQQKDLDTAHSINSLVVVLVLLVTVINVFIASFSISGTESSQLQPQS